MPDQTVDQKLDAILAQARLTNGRITALERQTDDMKADLHGYQIGTRQIPGVVQRVEEMEPLARQVRTAIKVGWVLAAGVLGQVALNVAEIIG